MRNKLRQMLIRHEGLKLEPYVDTEGYPTIGVGHKIRNITRKEAMELLDNDMEEVILQAETFSWFSRMNSTRQDVVLNMIFNLGFGGFKKFKRMIRALETRNYPAAALEMRDSKWARQVGKRAIELSQMMIDGR